MNPARSFRLLLKKATKNEPITIFGDGRQTRDFIYVKDVVAAKAFFALKSQATGIFNVACGRQITIADLALTIRNGAAKCGQSVSPNMEGNNVDPISFVRDVVRSGDRCG